MTDLTSLIERIEAATEGSRELDGAVATSLDWWPKEFTRVDSFASWRRWTDVDSSWSECVDAPQFSTSIDAALTLLPEGWWLTLDRYCISDKAPDPFAWRVWLKRLVGDVDGDGPCGTLRFFATGSTAPLALLAAILRARQTEPSHDES